MFIFMSECVLVFSLSGEYGYPVVKRTLPACPLSTSCVIHPYCYTDMLTRPSLPLHRRPSTVWLYLSAQRSVLSPLPTPDNRHHIGHRPPNRLILAFQQCLCQPNTNKWYKPTRISENTLHWHHYEHFFHCLSFMHFYWLRQILCTLFSAWFEIIDFFFFFTVI